MECHYESDNKTDRDVKMTESDSDFIDTEGDSGVIDTKGDSDVIDTEGDLGVIDTEGDSDVIDTEGDTDCDVMDTEGDSDVMDTEGDSDVIETEGDSDDIDTEGDSDVIDTEGDSNVIDTEGDSDFINTEGDSNVIGTEGDSDVINTEGDSNVIGTEGDSDVINTEGDSGVMDTAGDSDVIDTEGDSDVIDTEGESDFIETEGDSDVIDTEDDSDVIDTEGDSDVIDTEGDSDVIDTESGNDFSDTESVGKGLERVLRKIACEEAAQEGLWDVVIGHLNDKVCPADKVIGQLIDRLHPKLLCLLSLSKLHSAVLGHVLQYAWRNNFNTILLGMILRETISDAQLMDIMMIAVMHRQKDFLFDLFNINLRYDQLFRRCFTQFEHQLQDLDFVWIFPLVYYRLTIDVVSMNMGQGLFRTLIERLAQPSNLLPFGRFCLDYFHDRQFSLELQDDWKFACKQALEVGMYRSLWITIGWCRRDRSDKAAMVKIVVDTVIQGDETHSMLLMDLRFMLSDVLLLVFEYVLKLSTDQFHKLAAALEMWMLYSSVQKRGSIRAHSNLVEIPEVVSFMLEVSTEEDNWDLFESLANTCPDPDGVMRCLINAPFDVEKKRSVEKLINHCTCPDTAVQVLVYAVTWCSLDLVQSMIDKVDINQFSFLDILRRLSYVHLDDDTDEYYCSVLQLLCHFVKGGCSTVERSAVQGTEEEEINKEDTVGLVAGDAESETERQMSAVAPLLDMNDTSNYDALSEASSEQEAFELLPHFPPVYGELLVDVIQLMIKSGALTHKKLHDLRQSPALQKRLKTECDEHWIQSCEAVVEAAATPSSLQHLARLTASQTVGCGPGRSARIDKLPIPDAFKDKLRFEDVTKEFEDKIKEKMASQSTQNEGMAVTD